MEAENSQGRVPPAQSEYNHVPAVICHLVSQCRHRKRQVAKTAVGFFVFVFVCSLLSCDLRSQARVVVRGAGAQVVLIRSHLRFAGRHIITR